METSGSLMLINVTSKVVLIGRSGKCYVLGHKWLSKKLFISSFDLRVSIVKSVFDCRLPGVNKRCSACEMLFLWKRCNMFNVL